MQIRCTSCGRAVTVAATGALPERCPHCEQAPVPERLGKWRIERLLAAGGMGEVYVARHVLLGSRVAIKLLPRGSGTADAAALRERFAREAMLTAAIDHPGVVRVLDYEEEGDHAFLVLELLDGRSLRSLHRERPLSVQRAVEITAAIADVLAAAHARGVVHRDVKPENVVVAPDGGVRVLDFGIARALQDHDPITRTGEILGTPEYMAPEQLLEAADAVDARTDVHALGVLLYELLTGRSPFHGANLFQVLKLVESLVPPAPSVQRSEVPAEIDAVVARALQKSREQRFADAAQFAAALRSAMPVSDLPTLRRAPGRAGWWWGAAILVAFGLGLWLASIIADRGSEPDGAVGAASIDPRARVAALLAGDPLEPAELRDARDALRTATDSAALSVRGRASLRLGEFHAALDDLDRAATLGDAAAAEPAAVAWVGVHVLLPTIVGAPAWLSACDRRRRDRLFGVGDDAAGPGTVLQRACGRLARADAAGALDLLRSAGGELRGPYAPTVALLAARIACADPAVVERIEPGWRPAAPDVGYRLVAASLGARAELLHVLLEHVDGLDVHGSDRWLAEMCADYLIAAEDGSGTERMRAAAELAWLTGAGEVAPVWFVGLRLDLAAARPELALRAEEAERALRLIHGFDAAEHPALAAVRALLHTATGQDDAARSDLAGGTDPFLAPFDAWRDAPTPERSELYRALALRLVGRAPAAEAAIRALLDAHEDITADASLALATMTTDGDEARRLWRRAFAGGADLRLLDTLNARPVRAPDAEDLAIAFPTASVSVLPFVRACVRLGADPAELLAAGPLRALLEEPLRAAYVREVQGGIDG